MKKLIKCIIVSGPDNCGKDTACGAIKAELQNTCGVYPVYLSPKFSKAVRDWPGEMKALKRFAENFCETDNDENVLLLNRSWFDECVYGPTYRGYGPGDCEWVWEDLNSFLGYCRVLYVNLTAPTDVLVEREDGKSFSTGNEEVIKREQDLFEDIVKRLETGTTVSYVTFDTSVTSPEEIAAAVRDIYEKSSAE